MYSLHIYEEWLQQSKKKFPELRTLLKIVQSCKKIDNIPQSDKHSGESKLDSSICISFLIKTHNVNRVDVIPSKSVDIYPTYHDLF